MPPLQTQLLELQIATGLAQQIDARLLPNGAWAKIDNMLSVRNGSARKRDGYGFIPVQVYPDSPVEFIPDVADVIDSRGDELRIYGQHTDGLMWSWSWSESAQRWVRKDTTAQCSVQCAPVGSSYVASWLPQLCVTDAGRRAYGWLIGGNPTTLTAPFEWVTRVEDGEGNVLLDDFTTQIAGTGNFVQVVTGENLVILYTDSSAGNNLYSRTINLATGAIGAPVLQIALNIFRFHACAYDGTHYLIAWTDAAAPAQVTVQKRTTAGAIVDGLNVPTVGAVLAISIDARAGFGVSLATYEGATGVSTRGLADAPLALTWGPSTFGAGVVSLCVGTCIDDTGSVTTLSGIADRTQIASYDSAGVVTVFCVGMNTLPLSQPFRRDGRGYAALWQGDNANQTERSSLSALCVVDSDTKPVLVACLNSTAVPDAQSFAAIGGALPRPGATSADALLFPLSLAAGVPTTRQIGSATCDFTRRQSALQWASEQRSCIAHSGGFLGWDDGTGTVEIGTLAPVISQGAIGVGLVGNGTYLYTVTWEWYDEEGNRHESEPSAPLQWIVAAGPQSNTVNVQTLALTRKGGTNNGERRFMRAVLYRTDNNGSIFKRITPPMLGTATAGLVINDRAVPTVTLTDTLSDAQLDALGYGLLYTTGGIVPNVVPPPALGIVTHRNRLWMVSGEDNKELWYSKLIVPGEAPGFSPFLTLRVDDAPDGVTALGSMDDKLIVFSRERIYYLTGEGPNDTGAGGAFNGAFRIPTDFGSVDQRSVVTYPEGLLFWNGSGIYQLDRGLQVSFIGDPVKDITDGAVSVIAKLDAKGSRVWFLVTGPEDVGARFVVFDYRIGVWTSATIYGIVDGAEQPSLPVAHHWLNGEHWLGQVSDNGGVLVSARGNTPGYDGIAWFPATLETPWIHPAGVNGYQRTRRVWFTGRQISAHELVAQIYTDYDDTTVRQEMLFSASGATPAVGLPVERWGIHVKPQACSAIKIRFSDSAPLLPVVDSPTGWDIAGLALEIGVKGGYKLPITNKAGG